MRVRFQQQCEHSECGLACASMMLDYFVDKTNLSGMRERYGVPNGGYNLLQLQEVLKENGVISRAIRIGIESLKAVPKPFIAFWDRKHFVVVEKVSGGTVSLVDPASGKKKLTNDEFEEHFSKIILYPTSESTRKFQMPKLHPVLVKNAKKNSKLLIGTLIFSMIMQCLSLLIPYTIQFVIDGFERNMLFSLKLLLAILIGLSANYFIFNLIRTRVITKLQTAFDKGFLGDTIKQLLDLPYSYFVNRSKGELIYRINSNTYIRQVIIDRMIEIVIDVFFFFIYLVAMMCYSPALATFTIFVAGALCLISDANTKINRKIAQNEMVVTTKSQDMINEMINNIFTIKSTNSQKNLFNKWSDNFEKQIGLEKKRAKYSSILSNATQTIQSVYPLCIFLGGYFLMLRNKMTIGGIVAFSSIGASFLGPIIAIMSSYGQIVAVKIYLERLLDIMDTPNETETEGKELPSESCRAIGMDHVFYRYSKFSKYAVSDISVDIKPFEKVAIVGSSGSGKSTMMKVMASLYPVTSGHVLYEGKNVKDLNIHKLREKVGIVLQENMLFSGSFRENITMGRDFSDEEINKVIEATNLNGLLNSFPLGLDTIISESGQNLSGGQRQKIAIARTIISKPQIVFMDEPTSALDNASEKIVMDYLFNMKSTLVVVAHRLSTIRDFDRIIVMDKGRIVEQGNHEELMIKNGFYANLYRMQPQHDEIMSK
ncbi:MAG: peptidase domain-containing ABC transporter [Pseudobutyrivibrio sp.]|nr:peptidase domain-containing ABC transporter [Pseudobutyrivibrio sp.]